MAASLYGCSAGATTMTPTADVGLFVPTDAVGVAAPGPAVTRSRFVKLDWSLLLDENGQALDLPANAEITLNLFPDVTYTGVVEKIEHDGEGYSWIGHLKEVEFSSMFMVYTAGVLIGHFASPEAVYEVSNVGDDLFRIVQIDQSKLPQRD